MVSLCCFNKELQEKDELRQETASLQAGVEGNRESHFIKSFTGLENPTAPGPKWYIFSSKFKIQQDLYVKHEDKQWTQRGGKDQIVVIIPPLSKSIVPDGNKLAYIKR